MTQWLSARKTAKFLGTHPQTLRTWSSKGLIQTIRTPGNHRLYNVESFTHQGKEKEEIQQQEDRRQTLLYARVSSSHQRQDLERQIQYLQERYPSSTTISDVASGLNYRRKGLQRVLRLICEGTVSTLVVTHRDRLSRFGFELFETFFQHLGVTILVLDQEHPQDHLRDREHEVMDDILSINSFFIARLQGQRAQESRKHREHASQVQIGESSESVSGGANPKATTTRKVRSSGIKELQCPIVF